jgi:hypothetical protein
MINQETIEAMRDWIRACERGDLEEEDIEELCEEEILEGVSRHYSGGIKEFIRGL